MGGGATLLMSEQTDAVGDSAPGSILVCKGELHLKRLNLPDLVRTYASARSHVVVIDFNGTLLRKDLAGWGRISSVNCWDVRAWQEEVIIFALFSWM